MEAPVPFLPLATTQEYFMSLLGRLDLQEWPTAVELGDATACVTLPGDPPVWQYDMSRWMLFLEGSQKFAYSRRGQRMEREFKTGEAIYLARNAWTQEHWEGPKVFVGAVYLPDCVRLLVGDISVGAKPPKTPWAYHTSRPFGPVGSRVVQCLDLLARDPATQHRSVTGRSLFRALLQLTLEHVEQDRPEEPAGKAEANWNHLQQLVREKFSQDLSREVAAKCLGLHPNYLSTLCRSQGQTSFSALLRSARLEHARHLLGTTNLPLNRVARQCGYPDCVYFSRVFKSWTGMSPKQFRLENHAGP